MVGSMAGFTLNDSFMKAVSDTVPLFQAIFLRGMATTFFMLCLALFVGGLRFRLSGSNWRLIGMRTITEIGAAYFFLSAIFNMEFANAAAILQVLPLTITLAGAVFLGEPVGWRRWTAIFVGFFGVMLIVRPGFDGFTIYSVYVLIAVFLVTVRDILVRKLTSDVPTLMVATLNAISVTAFFGIGSIWVEWTPVDGTVVWPLLAAALLIVGGYIFSVSAMRVGEVAVVAPFRYTALLWALFLGLVVFGEWPDWIALVGATIVVLTGIYTFRREMILSRNAEQ